MNDIYFSGGYFVQPDNAATFAQPTFVQPTWVRLSDHDICPTPGYIHICPT
jgi:hypothetical protein